MTHDSLRDVQALPSGYSSAQAEFGVVGVGEEVFVEAANLVEHRLAVHGGAAVGPEDFLDGVELTGVELTTAAPAILAVPKDEMAGFVDAVGGFPDEDFRGSHAELGMMLERSSEGSQPLGGGFGIVVEEGNQAAAGGGDALVVGGAEAAVVGVFDDAEREKRGEFRAGEGGAAIGGAVVDKNDLKGLVGLAGKRMEAGAQEGPAIPVDDDDGDEFGRGRRHSDVTIVA